MLPICMQCMFLTTFFIVSVWDHEIVRPSKFQFSFVIMFCVNMSLAIFNTNLQAEITNEKLVEWSFYKGGPCSQKLFRFKFQLKILILQMVDLSVNYQIQLCFVLL